MTVDLRTCKPGDKLRCRNGDIVTYRGPNDGIAFSASYGKFPHMIEYSIDRYGTRTDDGKILPEGGEEGYDIVEILT